MDFKAIIFDLDGVICFTDFTIMQRITGRAGERCAPLEEFVHMLDGVHAADADDCNRASLGCRGRTDGVIEVALHPVFLQK